MHVCDVLQYLYEGLCLFVCRPVATCGKSEARKAADTDGEWLSSTSIWNTWWAHCPVSLYYSGTMWLMYVHPCRTLCNVGLSAGIREWAHNPVCMVPLSNPLKVVCIGLLPVNHSRPQLAPIAITHCTIPLQSVTCLQQPGKEVDWGSRPDIFHCGIRWISVAVLPERCGLLMW